MPIYEYQCGKCGAEYEQLESSDAPKRQICIKMCGGLATRAMSTPSIGRGSNNSRNNHRSRSDQSANPHGSIPENVMEKVREIKESSGANYILAGPIIKSKLWAITPISDHVGEAMVKAEQRVKAAPNN
jgi:putative FmdB family regulatory protein